MARLDRSRLNPTKKLKVEKVMSLNEKNTQEFSDLTLKLDHQIEIAIDKSKKNLEPIKLMLHQEGERAPFWLARSSLQNWGNDDFAYFNRVVFRWADDHHKKKREALEHFMTILLQMNLHLTQEFFLKDLRRQLKNAKSLSYDSITKVHCVLAYIANCDPIMVNDTDFSYHGSLNGAQYAISCYRHELQHQLDGVPLTRDNLEYLTAAGRAEYYVNQYLPLDDPHPDDPFSNVEYQSTQNDDEDDNDLDLPF